MSEISCSAGSNSRETEEKVTVLSRHVFISNSVSYGFISIKPEMVTVEAMERLTKMVSVESE